MSVHVQGSVVSGISYSGPASPLTGPNATAGQNKTVQVGPYTNNGTVPFSVSNIVVSNLTGATANGTPTLTSPGPYPVGSVFSINVPLTAGAVGSYSFDLDFTAS